jgi:hypothetical protein
MTDDDDDDLYRKDRLVARGNEWASPMFSKLKQKESKVEKKRKEGGRRPWRVREMGQEEGEG